MPIGINSPARNLFLLGSSGSQLVTNFFKLIDQSLTTNNSYVPAEIKYNESDDRYLLSGTALDTNLVPNKGFGWFEKRDDAGTADWEVRVESTSSGVNTTLRAMELDSNDNLIVVGKTGDVPWIAKYSNGGVIDWQSTTNSGDVEYTGITSDSSGNYYACGSTPTSGSAQAFVEKFDANGNPDWGKSAFMLGRDVVLTKIDANDRGEVVAVGYLQDDTANKGYIIKIDTNTGEVLWDRTLSSQDTTFPLGALNVAATNVKIDDKGQIYVVGTVLRNSFVIKYTAEGNMIWQKETNLPVGASAPDIQHVGLTVNSVTESVTVASYYFALGANEIYLSNYNKKGDLIWRRSIDQGSSVLSNPSLDNEGAFIYFLFDAGSNTNATYTYGKLSSTGNGLGDFEYNDGTATLIDYQYVGTGYLASDVIGRLSDGSVRQDTSDLITYPFNANKLLFDDLATQVSNKKRQMDSPDSFEYSGSPAIRPADFQELNLLGNVYSGSGNWLDQSGKGNDGVVNGATYNAAGYWEFDGVDDYIKVGIDPTDDYSNFTVEVWFQPFSVSNYENVIDCNFNTSWASGNVGPRLEMYATGRLTWLISDSITDNQRNAQFDVVSGDPGDEILVANWYHCAITFDGSGAAVYLNGQQTRTTPSNTNGGATGGEFYGFFTDVRIGNGFHLSQPPTTEERLFTGNVGEVRIYPRALTAAQVFQNYNATKSKYILEAPDTAPKIGPGIVYDSNLLLNYDFGNRATYDRAENLIPNSEIRYTADGGIWQDLGRSTLEYGFDDPFGGKTATKVTKISGDGLIRLPNFTLVGNSPWSFTVYAKVIKGPQNQSGALQLDISDSFPDGGDASLHVLTNKWRRYKVTNTSASVNGGAAADYLDISFGPDMEEVLLAGAQLESNGSLAAGVAARYIKTSGTAITAPTTVKNLSSTSYAGTINGATFNSAGYFVFDGSNDDISVSSLPAFADAGAITIESWANADTTTNTFQVIATAKATTTHWQLSFTGDPTYNILWAFAGTANSVGTTTLPSTGAWHHITATYNGGDKTQLASWKVYIDGSEATIQLTGSTGSATNDTIIGHRSGGPTGNRFDGNIGEVRIYNRALTATEVSQNFNATRSKYGV